MDIMKKNRSQEENVQTSRGNSYRSPATDIFETDEYYELHFDVPGVEKEDIVLSVENQVLVLRAECKKNPGDDYRCLQDEMVYSSFRRSFDLGDAVNPEGIKAEYSNGALTVRLPKKESQKTRKIEISVA